jgi:hypothetical protein
MAENSNEEQPTWLSHFISSETEHSRFRILASHWYADLTIQDFKFMDLDDFLRFIPSEGVGPDAYCTQKKIEELARDRGIAGVLWKRYIEPKIRG